MNERKVYDESNIVAISHNRSNLMFYWPLLVPEEDRRGQN